MLISDIGAGIYVGQLLKEDVNWRTHIQENWNPKAISELVETDKQFIRQGVPNKKRISFVMQDSDKIQELQRILIKKHLS